MNAYWSWLLTAVGVTGLYLAGRKVWWAWFVGLGAQVLWLGYAITTAQYGFLVSAFAYGWVYAKNGRAWLREHRATVADVLDRLDAPHSFADCDCHDSWDQCPCAESGHTPDCHCCGYGTCGPLTRGEQA